MKLLIHFFVLYYQSNFFQFSFYNLIFWILKYHCRVSKNQKIYRLSQWFQFLSQFFFIFNLRANFIYFVFYTWAIWYSPIIVYPFTKFNQINLDNTLSVHIFLWFSSTSVQKPINLTFGFNIFHSLSLPFPKLSIFVDICKHYCISILIFVSKLTTQFQIRYR